MTAADPITDPITVEESWLTGNWWWECHLCDATGWAFERWGAEVAGTDHRADAHDFDPLA